ncbi:MAG: hypothetical protein ACI4SG_06740 [Oligosphaeraceae bacterium]
MSTQYFVFEGNRRMGPYDLGTIYSFSLSGQLRPDAYVQAADSGQYLQVRDVLNVGAPPPAVAAPPPAWPPQNSYPGQPQAAPPAQWPPVGAAAFPSMGAQPPAPAPAFNPGMGYPPAPAMPQYAAAPPAPAPGFSPAPAMPQYAAPPAPAPAPGFSPAPAMPQVQYGGATPSAAPFVPQVAPLVTPVEAPASASNETPMVQPLVEPLENENVFPPPEVTMRKWYNRTGEENGNVVCPHCWGRCALDQILYVSSHAELTGDPLLGPDALRRFLPKYYTSKGTPLDARGMECTDMACPHCHQKIPNSVVDLPTSFFSIVGAPASGKSYFLTSLVWRLRNILPGKFNFSFYDTDPQFNMVLNDYEKLIFMNPDPGRAVSLPKTELQGTGYSNQIEIEGNALDLPKPFVFTMAPQESHPEYATRKKELERGIVFYDNAGEHFEVGRNTASNLASLHLLHSDGIIFFYDPLKDTRMKEQCSPEDPQISRIANFVNQNTFFTEMASRIRKLANLQANEKFTKPLVVVVPKYDSWRDTFPLKLEGDGYIAYDENGTACLEMGLVSNVSFCLRRMLLKIAPEIVGLAEGFAEKVYFVPVSALGRIPEYDPLRGMIGIRPEHIQPIWVELPFLLLLHLSGYLPGGVGQDDTLPKVEDVHFLNGKAVFNFPGGGERFTVPDYYCGNILFNEEDGKNYVVPPAPERILSTPEPASARQGEDAVQLKDMNFWEN